MLTARVSQSCTLNPVAQEALLINLILLLVNLTLLYGKPFLVRPAWGGCCSSAHVAFDSDSLSRNRKQLVDVLPISSLCSERAGIIHGAEQS
jgi:hypothetical protein